MTRLLLAFALALSTSCATVRPSLCAASDVALTVQHETPSGKAAVSVGRFLRGLLCPREAPTGATDRLTVAPAASL